MTRNRIKTHFDCRRRMYRYAAGADVAELQRDFCDALTAIFGWARDDVPHTVRTMRWAACVVLEWLRHN